MARVKRLGSTLFSLIEPPPPDLADDLRRRSVAATAADEEGAAAAAAAAAATGAATAPHDAATVMQPVEGGSADGAVLPSLERKVSVLSAAGDEGMACVICMERRRNAILIPCGHGDLCFECAKEVATRKCECPICRSAIKEVLIYDSKAIVRHQQDLNAEHGGGGSGGDGGGSSGAAASMDVHTTGGFTVDEVTGAHRGGSRARALAGQALVAAAAAEIQELVATGGIVVQRAAALDVVPPDSAERDV